MDYKEMMNSPLLWAVCAFALSTVIIQAVIFTRKALKVGKEIGVTNEQVKQTVKVSLVSSLGPTMSVVAGALSLLVCMGGPVSWLRLGFIGSVGYEISTAGFGAAAMGTTLTSSDFDGYAFACAFFAMWFGASGWLLTTGLFAHKLDVVRNKLAGSAAFLPILSACAMAGAFAYLSMDHVFSMDAKRIIAVVSGFVTMSFLNYMEKKKNWKWVKEWGITISMLTGPVIAIIFF